MKKEHNDLEVMRHSMSHVMAAAVKELWPDVKFAIGPSIENGFYYDFDFGKEKVGEEDLRKIEKKMKHIIKQNQKFEQREMGVDDAIKKEKEAKQEFKVELIEDLKKEGETKVSYYKSGNFEDLCRGPHIESTGKIKQGSYRLTKLAGAYWRGDENRQMLTRIYGVAFETKEELESYIKMMEEAIKRDHRRIGKELDLFSFHEEALGMPFFHPKGGIIYKELMNFWIESQKEFDYDYINCPSMLDVGIWKQSGHWDHYKDDMFFIDADEERQYALRPMDCPGAILIYNNSPKSYRNLPVRYAEPGLITRKEKSGQLGGLLRVQQFKQDDAHMFITEDQIENEIKSVITLVDKMYKPFGLEYKAYLSTRPDDSMGDIKVWDKAEGELKKILEEVYGEGNYGIKDKDGAFYGPKIDYQLKDCIGRTWQCATIQLDFQMPLKFDCKYVDKDGKEKVPVMIHRTILGSFERFMGILIEHFAGAFPVWLSPVQVKLVAVGGDHHEFCYKLVKEFEEKNIRVEVDDQNETVGNKIRKAVNEKVPYILVIGDKEMNSENLAVRDRGQEKTREISKNDFIKEVLSKIERKET